MFVGEVHVEIFAHMESSQDAIKFILFVEYLVSQCKLNCIKIGKNKEERHQVVTIPESPLELRKISKNFEKEGPVEHHCHIQTDSEGKIFFQ